MPTHAVGHNDQTKRRVDENRIFVIGANTTDIGGTVKAQHEGLITHDVHDPQTCTLQGIGFV
jgi:hypothetical protein